MSESLEGGPCEIRFRDAKTGIWHKRSCTTEMEAEDFADDVRTRAKFRADMVVIVYWNGSWSASGDNGTIVRFASWAYPPEAGVRNE